MEFKEIGLSDVGRVRAENEDYYGSMETPNGSIIIVCDGMGGHVGGKEASTTAVENMLSYMSNKDYSNPILAHNNSIIFVNSQINKKANDNPELQGMGTTVVALLIQDENIFIAHVGDSRIYLLSDKKLHRITKDHSVVQQMVDRGIITPEEAETHSAKNQILKALGIEDNVEPTLSDEPILAKKDDIFLLCSDGLSDMVDDTVIHKVLTDNALNLEQKAELLIQLALEAGGKDNVTVELVKIIESLHTKNKFVSFSYNQTQKETTDKNLIENNNEHNKNIEKNDEFKNLDTNNDIIDNNQNNKVSQKKKIFFISLIFLVLIAIIIGSFIQKKYFSPKYEMIIYKNDDSIDTKKFKNIELASEYFDKFCESKEKEQDTAIYTGLVWIIKNRKNENKPDTAYKNLNTKKIIAHENIWDTINKLDENFYAIKKDNKWGFTKTPSDTTIRCEYSEYKNLKEGMLAVKKNEKWGFINKTGKLIIPCEYIKCLDFNENFAAVKKNENNGWGYIRPNNEKLTDFEFHWADDFINGMAAVSIAEEKYGYVNEKGEKIKCFEFIQVGPFEENGEAEVVIKTLLGSKKRIIIDKTGKKLRDK